MAGESRERWKFVKQPMIEHEYVVKIVGWFLIVYGGMLTLNGASAVLFSFQDGLPISITFMLVGLVLIIGGFMVLRVPPMTRYHSLLRSGVSATARIHSKDRDAWTSDWGAWEEHKLEVDLSTPLGKQTIWSKIDADTYFHADAGETHEVVLDFEHHRWTWKPASSSAESSSG